MLTDAPVMITFSVDDFVAAKQFYGEQLGLTVDDTSMPGMMQLKLGDGTTVWLYRKDDHKPATYTLLNFSVDDLAKTMDEMKAKGIRFEQYDEPNTKTDENGVVDYGVFKIAFFNDPAGNNHAVMHISK